MRHHVGVPGRDEFEGEDYNETGDRIDAGYLKSKSGPAQVLVMGVHLEEKGLHVFYDANCREAIAPLNPRAMQLIGPRTCLPVVPLLGLCRCLSEQLQKARHRILISSATCSL